MDPNLEPGRLVYPVLESVDAQKQREAFGLGDQLAPITFTLTGIALLFICGFWISFLLLEQTQKPEFLVSVPVFGLIVLVLGISNLNYLGVPAKYSTIAILGGSIVADLAILRYRRPYAEANWLTWGIVAACTLLFLLPNAINGGFPAFNDAVYYSAVADFVRDRSYFAPAEPAGTYPWLSQMLSAQIFGGRMGAQYFLAALSSLTGGDGFSTFIPATACGLFVSLCGFWILARQFLQARWAPIAALAIYGTNMAFVQQPGSLNWLSQSIAFGPMFAFIAFGLTTSRWHWRTVLLGGLFVASLASIYPEILPFASVPIAVFVSILLIRNWRTWSSQLAFWASVILCAFLLNPYTWFYTLRSLLIELHGRLGFDFMQLSWWPMDLYFGLVSTVRFSTPWLMFAAQFFSVVLLCVAVAGLLRLKRDYLFVVIGSGLIYLALAMQQLYLRDYSYGFHKLLVYSYYLVPLCLGCGLALFFDRPLSNVARKSGILITAIWISFWILNAYRFIITCYFSVPFPLPPGVLSPAQTASAFTDLSSVSVIPKQGERTLIICPIDSLDRWIPYFFRRPVGDLFMSDYFSVIFNRPVTHPETFDYYLTLRPQTSWKDESRVLFSNPLFSFGKAQTTMITTSAGWYGAEGVGPGAPQWMGKKAKTLVIAPASDVISIESEVSLLADGRTRHLQVTMNGEPAGRFEIKRPGTKLEIPDLKVHSGLNDLFFETDEEATRPSQQDTRLLSLRFEGLRIRSNAPSSLDMFKPLDVSYVKGLTADRWITSAGVEVSFSTPHDRKQALEFSGEAVSTSVPGAIQITTGDGRYVRVPILKPGPFAGRALIELEPDLKDTHFVLTLKTERTFVPSKSSTSTDVRHLGFRLESLRIISAN